MRPSSATNPTGVTRRGAACEASSVSEFGHAGPRPHCPGKKGGPVPGRAPVVLVGALSLNAFSILCEGDHSILSLWAMAYVAMLLQNTAHDVSSQRATLRKLQVYASGDEKTRFEWSHVTYFTDLLFHSCYQSVSGNFNAADVPSALKKEIKDD